MASESSKSGGIGFVGLLTIAFVVLKLLGKIGWSWGWVLSPVWITAALVVIVLLGAFVVAVISASKASPSSRPRFK